MSESFEPTSVYPHEKNGKKVLIIGCSMPYMFSLPSDHPSNESNLHWREKRRTQLIVDSFPGNKIVLTKDRSNLVVLSQCNHRLKMGNSLRVFVELRLVPKHSRRSHPDWASICPSWINSSPHWDRRYTLRTWRRFVAYVLDARRPPMLQCLLDLVR